MPRDTPIVTPHAIRRLAVAKQHLDGSAYGKANKADIESLVRDLCYVQWDPVPIVGPSHILSIWARLGKFHLSDLDSLMWEEKKVFEHWTPIASLVLTEDYPLYYSLMTRYPESLSHSWGNHIAPAKKFLASHASLRRRILKELEGGPKQVSEFGDHRKTRRPAHDWGWSSDVPGMLYHMHMKGEVMVVGHRGNQNVWGLTSGFLPRWAKREALGQDEFERAAAQRAIRALGTAAPHEIVYYFVRGRYQNLKNTLAGLQGEGLIHRVVVKEYGPRDERYVHDKDLTLLDEMESDDGEPRLTLIPPFDNMLAGDRRLSTLFGFRYTREQFLPKEKRKYGTYVLPIVYGDRMIGRVDPWLDKKRAKMVVNSVHAEPGAPGGKEVSAKLEGALEDLAGFMGAEGVEYAGRVPGIWAPLR